MLLTVKNLSTWLTIKPSTLYLWAAQGKIPCRKIHGLIRFDREQILVWLQAFERKLPGGIMSVPRAQFTAVDELIEAAKREAYTRHEETRPTASPTGKE